MSLDDIRLNRVRKLENLRRNNIDPYPDCGERTHRISELKKEFDRLADRGEKLKIVGRLFSLREHGGSSFANLEDESGRLQLYFKKDKLPDYQFWLSNIDIGDFLEVSGTLFKTRKGEETLEVSNWKILSKSLLPLPEKWHGLKDVEERFRKRYLDLLFNKEAKEKFILRAKIIDSLKDILKKDGFLEVETPILQTLAGGALAKPFKTHLNILDLELYLRIAPELFLKRLLVGGFEKIFEIGRNFRNEGIDREHNPEFTMLEAYTAYKNYEWLMDYVENLLGKLVQNLFDRLEIEYSGKKINFSHKFERIAFDDLLRKYTLLDYFENSQADFEKKAEELKIKIEKALTKENIADELYKKVVRPNIINPTFVIDHPVELSPLAKNKKDNPKKVARFQLLVGGMELVNAFSELNDPLQQRQRFEIQAPRKNDEEAHHLDEDFITALEYGMPPAAGFGLGIDRLTVLLTNSSSIREIVLFPLLKPKS